MHSNNPNSRYLASVHVESLFINVSLKEIRELVTLKLYNTPKLPPTNLRPTVLRKLLISYLKQVPFYDYYGNIYTETDGIALGSPLVKILSNDPVENKIFDNFTKPSIYARYVDNIFILALTIGEF